MRYKINGLFLAIPAVILLLFGSQGIEGTLPLVLIGISIILVYFSGMFIGYGMRYDSYEKIGK